MPLESPSPIEPSPPDDARDGAAPSPAQPSEPRCHRHPEQPAIALCSRCDRPACHLCHGSDLRGFCLCLSCRQAALPKPGTPWDDPQSERAIEALAQTCYAALRHPRTFWQPIPPSTRALPAVVFALLCISLGVTMQTAWGFALDPELEERLRETLHFDMPRHVLRALALLRVVIVAPLILFTHASFLNFAVRMAGAKPHLALTLRITGYACAAYLLRFIPPVFGLPIGQVLMIFWLYNLELYGVLRYYPLERNRAMFAVLGAMIGSILLGLI